MDDRTLARLAAVQAIYQDKFNENIVPDPRQYVEANEIRKINKKLFAAILENWSANKADIDELIKNNLSTNWRMERVDEVLKAALRAGITEILHMGAPKKVVISEYMLITDELHSSDGVKFINAVLDKIAADKN
ncbi:MAG: transcription antitermination factor NusB [Alphaproteobacteria bacterium CG11_big_fil_rev_8_21_14_0_20_44_7]|nr:MAG: transcription antitermination factor NusB [Alphaproteobacteria bacterium CG11_big_fil_rev_8_21_14_0_20_44_7]